MGYFLMVYPLRLLHLLEHLLLHNFPLGCLRFLLTTLNRLINASAFSAEVFTCLVEVVETFLALGDCVIDGLFAFPDFRPSSLDSGEHSLEHELRVVMFNEDLFDVVMLSGVFLEFHAPGDTLFLV